MPGLHPGKSYIGMDNFRAADSSNWNSGTGLQQCSGTDGTQPSSSLQDELCLWCLPVLPRCWVSLTETRSMDTPYGARTLVRSLLRSENERTAAKGNQDTNKEKRGSRFAEGDKRCYRCMADAQKAGRKMQLYSFCRFMTPLGGQFPVTFLVTCG